MANNTIVQVIGRTPLQYNLKFINSLRKGRGNVKSCLQSNGSLQKLKLYQLFDKLQGNESNIARTLRELSGGPLALISSNHPMLLNLIVSGPFGAAPPLLPVPTIQPTQPIPPIVASHQFPTIHLKKTLIQRLLILNFVSIKSFHFYLYSIDEFGIRIKNLHKTAFSLLTKVILKLTLNQLKIHQLIDLTFQIASRNHRKFQTQPKSRLFVTNVISKTTLQRIVQLMCNVPFSQQFFFHFLR